MKSQKTALPSQTGVFCTSTQNDSLLHDIRGYATLCALMNE